MNKNISVWRGLRTPPTNYHVWIREDNTIYLHDGSNWNPVIDSDAMQYDTLSVNVFADKANILGSSIDGKPIVVEFPAATTENAGVMTAQDKRNLDNSTVKVITWVNEGDLSNMNDFTDAGVYDIKGERTREKDNLPILNYSKGHTFHARLIVLDSSITGTNEDNDKCITQVLSFNNRLGQGEVYIRTGKGSALDTLSWEPWSTLQRNVNVGEVETLDNLVENGIYSGIWTKSHYNNYSLTFVCVVVNDYFLNTPPRRISQFVYGLSKFTGAIIYQTRVWDDSLNKWGDWEILNQNEITSMISDEIKKVTDGIDTEKIDSIKDIVAWIDAHGGEVTAIYNAIEDNNININEEINRATQEENNIKSKAIAIDDIGYSTTEDDLSIEVVSIDGENSSSVTLPAATTEKAGVMSAEDKQKLDSLTQDSGGDITAEETDSVVSNIEESVVASALRKTRQELTESEKLQARENIDAQKELTLTIKDNGNIVIGNIQGETKEFMPATPSGDPMFYAYIAAGAEYLDLDGKLYTNKGITNYTPGADKTKTTPWNETVTHKAGHYYLNGLGDLTEEDMARIYDLKEVIYKLDCNRILQHVKNVRTIFPSSVIGVYDALFDRKLKGLYSFNNTDLEELVFHPESQTEIKETRLLPVATTLQGTFASSPQLKRIGGIHCLDVTFKETFDGCTSLIEVRLYKVSKSVSFQDSANISKNSILYIIQNAIPTSAITITLHHNAYEKLAIDEDIITALTDENKALLTKGGKISLVCATHSEEITPNA